ncbi:putative lipoprotein [Plesiocystis pacifica SIR-1]|uniref:Putative lipoprotein n=1 Tax=Plesiocystis pacifica SIR-1 TaxID=391625 RepID=A6GDG5_9BACT|nr:VWA domain-containing protein [Plesiocystis pacifica]EDM76077.1 putative lipoprotein [Plesiocystis pacifica SIR-1]
MNDLAPALCAIAVSLACIGVGCGDDGGSYDDELGECAGCGVDDGELPEPPPEEQELPKPSEVCDEETPVTLHLSPDDSNSMASPVMTREVAPYGFYTTFEWIRPWEFLNYYSFEYPAADPGDLSVHVDLRSKDEGRFQLQIGVASEIVSPSERLPMNITLVLDESTSMTGAPMYAMKATARAIAGSLREGDVISLVSWSNSNNVRLASHAVAGSNDATLLDTIDAIEPGGGTDLHAGLEQGYALAQANFSADRINRVVLVSDGGANLGFTDAELIAQMAELEDGEGIYMVGVGVGDVGRYNDELMDTVTDQGKGASVFIPNEAEAERMFGERFMSTMGVAARDVRVELSLPPGFEIVRFSGEEFSDDPSEIEPQHLAPNDAMVFYQELETCAPELATEDALLGVVVRWREPFSKQARERAVEYAFADLLGAESPMLDKGQAILSYAEVFATGLGALEQAEADLAAAEQALPGDSDLAEIRSVLDML